MRLNDLAIAGVLLAFALTGCASRDAGAPRAAEPMPSNGYPGGSGGMAMPKSPPRDRGVVVASTREEVAMDSAVSGSAYNDGPAPPPPPPPPQPPQAPSPGAQNAPAKVNAAQQPPQARDFVIYTANFTMAVYQVDTGIAAVEKIAREHNGYLSSKKDREIVIRVPRAQFEVAVQKVDKVGDVLHRDIAALDVTDEHVDLEIRIKNARAMQKQLTDLLARANVKEALEIEKELGRVTEELERLEGRLKLLNDKIAFSTISVQFEARGQSLQTQRVRLPFAWLNTLNLPTLLQLNEDK